MTAAGLVWLAGCATPTTTGPAVSDAAIAAEQQRQMDFTARQYLSDQTRVHSIATRLLESNVDSCPKKAGKVGAIIHSLDLYDRKARKTTAVMLGARERPTVLIVTPGSPADEGGLQPGDQILAVNGDRIREKRPGQHALELLSKAPPTFTVAVGRDGEVRNLRIFKKQSCGYSVHLADIDQVNAFADGDNIVVTRGMLRFIENDNELALVLAHELAHNAERHNDAKDKNELFGKLGGAVIDGVFAAYGLNTAGGFTELMGKAARSAYSQEFEAEADYVGMYFLTRAGYDTGDVETFWRRMAAKNPSDIVHARTHPTTAERFVRLSATREEIEGKQLAGLLPHPNRKEDGSKADGCGDDCAPIYAASDERPDAPATAFSAPVDLTKEAPVSPEMSFMDEATHSDTANTQSRPESRPSLIMEESAPEPMWRDVTDDY